MKNLILIVLIFTSVNAKADIVDTVDALEICYEIWSHGADDEQIETFLLDTSLEHSVQWSL